MSDDRERLVDSDVGSAQVEGLAAPQGYSPVVVHRGAELAHVSGQVGRNEHNEVPPRFRDEVLLAFANLEDALASVGYGLSDVVKLTTYLVDTKDVPMFQEARAEVLAASHRGAVPFPASTLVVVRSLADPSWRVEIDAVAVHRS